MITKGEILYSYFLDDDNIDGENCLVKGTIVKRPSKHVKSPYMADVILDSIIDNKDNNSNESNESNEILAHTPALGCNGYVDKGQSILLLKNKNPNTKSSHKVEFAYDNDNLVGTNPYLSNDIVGKMITEKKFPQFAECNITNFKREKTVGNSRFDVYFENGETKYYIEVKTAPVKDPIHNNAIFPKGYRKKKTDSFSPRAVKHLEELGKLAQDPNNKCYLIYVVPRTDIDHFSPCKDDPVYCEAYLNAVKSGVSMISFCTTLDDEKSNIVFDRFLKIKFSWIKSK
jgi:sugar fermentation stimulation protein A